MLVNMNAMMLVSAFGKMAERFEKTASVGQSRCIKDANLCKRLQQLTASILIDIPFWLVSLYIQAELV